MKKILFVCTGNTCRSCMAEALFRNLLDKEGLSLEYSVDSAGTCTYGQQPASRNAEFALAELGIDLSYHASKPVEKEMLREAYLIFTMTKSHKNYLQGIDHKIMEKVFTLKEYCGESVESDICDPFGGDINIYNVCRNEIFDNLKKLIVKIKKSK